MSILIISAVVVGFFVLIGIGASRSDRATLKALRRNGRLCLGTVLGYDSDDIASVEFFPMGATAPIRAFGLGSFQKKQFPQGSKVAVLYNPLCPAVNRVVPERTSEL